MGKWGGSTFGEAHRVLHPCEQEGGSAPCVSQHGIPSVVYLCRNRSRIGDQPRTATHLYGPAKGTDSSSRQVVVNLGMRSVSSTRSYSLWAGLFRGYLSEA